MEVISFVNADKAIVDRASAIKHKHDYRPFIPKWVPQWMEALRRWGFHDQIKKPFTRQRINEKYSIRPGGHTTPELYCTFQEAKQGAQYKAMKGERLGLSFFLGDSFGGIDLDQVRDPETGSLTILAGNVYLRATQLGAYVEISPSGCGFKIYGKLSRVFRADRNSIKVSYGLVDGHFDEEGKPLESYTAFECWNDKRHFCVTGLPIGSPTSTDNPVDITPILDLIEADPIIQTAIGQEIVANHQAPSTDSTDIDPEIQREINFLASQPVDTNESIAKWFNKLDSKRIGDWLIQSFGWKFHSVLNQNEMAYTRPGKENAKGHSGVLYLNSGSLHVFTTADRLSPGHYSLFELYKILFFAGDHREAGRTLGEWKRAGTPGSPPIVSFRRQPAQLNHSLAQTALANPVQPQAEHAPLMSPEQPKPKRLGVGTPLKKLKERYGSLTWIWKDWIGKDIVHLVTGDSGAGKTTVIADILIKLHLGMDLPNGEQPSINVKGRKILYVDADVRAHRQLDDLIQKYKDYEGQELDPFDVFELLDRPFPRTATNWEDHKDFFSILAETLKEDGYWCLVVDTVSRFAGSSRLEVVNEISKFATPLNMIARDLGIPVFLIGHANASGSAMGKHLVGACDIGWKLTKKSDGGELTCARSQGAPPEPGCYRFKFTEKHLEWSAQAASEGEPKSKYSEANSSDPIGDWILDNLNMQRSCEVQYLSNSWSALFDLAKKAGVVDDNNKSSFSRALKRLESADLIVSEEHKSAKGKTYTKYELPKSS